MNQNKLQSRSLVNLISKIKIIIFDFDGVFTNNTVIVSQDGNESVCCWRGDGLGIQKLTKLDIDFMVLSSEENPVVSVRCRKLGIKCIQGCKDKLTFLKQIAENKGIELNEIAFMGNDINDLACLEAVGLPIVVADAHLDVINIAEWVTKFGGGLGAVREVCDLFFELRKPLQGD